MSICIIQNLLFLISTIKYNIGSFKNFGLNVINKCIYFTYILSYLILPDSIDVTQNAYNIVYSTDKMLFSLININDGSISDILIALSFTLFVMNIVLIITQLILLNKGKKRSLF